ncbi:AraC family transcriptional regulator [Paenibacillus sp. IB182496]|uniref:AraC family transcriptional regulator n=1 Tax=Paenibacillus sabuli TaxID=2772509 RepID=A0A927BVV0_9BACL|nr:helix-turn-helix domain-containing protein [Paenibacillus sabuli]MBD2847798.1 AraC family transcriptional regulator [Paenibacillus sabuli]
MMKYSYLKKLFIYSLILGALPVIAMGVFSYHRASTVIQNKVDEANRQILSRAKNSIEHKLETAHIMATQFASSTLAASALGHDLNRHQFEVVNDLVKTIQGFQVFDFVESVYFVNLEKQWLISYEGLERLNEAGELSEWTALLSSPTQWETRSGEGTVRLIKPLPFLSGQSPPRAAFVLQFSPRLFDALVRSESFGDTVIYNENMEMIFRNSETLSSEEQQAKLKRALERQSAEQQDIGIELDGAPMLTTVQNSAYNGWKYVSLVHLSEITKESEAIGWVTLLVCLTIVLITLSLAWQGSKMFYSPIRRLRDLVASSSQESASSAARDEIQYIRTGIQGLLGNKLELQKQLQKQFPYLHELFVIKLLLGQLSSKEINGHIEMFEMACDWRQFSVLTLRIYSLDRSRFEEEDLGLILYAVKNMMEEIMTAAQPFKPVIMNESCMAIVVDASDEKGPSEERLMRICEEIKEKIQTFLGLEIQLGLSRFHSELEQASIAFADSTAALHFCQRTGYRGVMRAEEADPGRLLEMTYPARREQDLLEAVQSGNREAANAVVDSILEEVEKRHFTQIEAQALFYQLFVKLIGLLQRDEQSLKKMLLDVEHVQTLFRTTSFEELGHWFTCIGLEPLFQLLLTRQQTHQSQMAQKIKEVVHTRFEDNLTLEAIADLMNFNANYLSRVFKKEVGMSFSDYMANTKLEMAKRLLTESELKVQEVAEKLHYQSTAAFIRYFRKMEGMTPSRYREMIQ